MDSPDFCGAAKDPALINVVDGGNMNQVKWLAASIGLLVASGMSSPTWAASGVSPSSNSAAATLTRPAYVRINVEIPVGGGEVPVVVVPDTGTRQFILTQTFTDLPPTSSNYGAAWVYTGCRLLVNGTVAVQLMTGFMAGLNVPFKTGDAVTLACYNYSNWTFVFSR